MQSNTSTTYTERLQHVASVYRFWGRHPGIYAAQDYVTFLGRPQQVRTAASPPGIH